MPKPQMRNAHPHGPITLPHNESHSPIRMSGNADISAKVAALPM
ncbi:Uncharacterised protein [Mycobacteroides abscessus subsp. abscessus]|nr:Uncharacterised protein [Mycobacteroides abscessus subsp. abscessus]